MFRIEPFTCTAALCLSVPAAGFTLWLTANYHEPNLNLVYALLLVAMSFATASMFAGNVLFDGGIHGPDGGGIVFNAEKCEKT